MQSQVYRGPWQASTYRGAWQHQTGIVDAWDQAWLYDASGPTWTDYTTEVNDDNDDDFFLLGPGASTVDDAFYLGSVSGFDAVTIHISTPGSGNWVIVKEYWNGSAWVEFGTVIEDTQTDWKSSGTSTFIFTPDGDWTMRMVNGAGSYYWIRFRAASGNTMSVRPGGGNGKSRDADLALVGSIADTVSLADGLLANAADTLDDGITLADAVVANAVTALSDLLSFADAIALGAGRNIADGITLTDAIVTTAAQVLEDILALSDDISANAVAALADALVLVDVLREGGFAIIGDGITLSDLLTLAVAHQIDETLSLTDAFTIAVSSVLDDVMTIAESLAGVTGSGITTPGIEDVAQAGVGLPGLSKQPKTWRKTITNRPSPISALTQTSVNTTFTQTGLTDASAWDLTEIERGDVAITEDEYLAIVLSTGANSITVRGWWKGGVKRQQGATDRPADGSTVTIHRLVRASKIVLRPQQGANNTIYIGFDENVTPVTGHPLSIIQGAINQELPIQAPRDRWLNTSRIWAVVGTDQVLEITAEAAAVGGGGDLSAPLIQESMSVGDSLTAGASDVIEDSLVVADQLTPGAGITIPETFSIADNLVGVLTPGNGGTFPTGSPIYHDVLVNSPYAYVTTRSIVSLWGVSSGLFIFDVSDVSNPTRLSYLELVPAVGGLLDSGIRLEKVGDIIYISSGYGLYSIDVSDPANPVQLDYIALSVAAFGTSAAALAIYGSIAYTTNIYGIRLVDISDPSNLVRIDMGMSAPKDWEYERWYRYLGNWGALIDPPDHDGTWGPDPFYHPYAGDGGRWFTANSIYDIRVDASYVYLLDDGVIWIFDRTAPYALQQICTCVRGPNNDGWAMSFDLDGTTAYVNKTTIAGWGLIAVNTGTNAIIENTDPTDPGALPFYGETLVVGDYVYVNLKLGVSIVHIPTFTEVGYVEGYTGPGTDYGFRGMYVYNDHLYVTWYESSGERSVRIYDLADKTNPVHVGTCQWDVGPWPLPSGGDTATFVDNPNKGSRYPNDNAADSYARSVLDMDYRNGEIRIGSGDYVNNRGPIDVYTMDSVESFAIETVLQEHEVNKITTVGGATYVPGIDAVVGGDGYFYTKTGAGAWVQSGAITGAVHVYDIVKLGSDYYARLGLVSPTRIEIHKYDGAWAQLLADSPWLVSLSSQVIMIADDRYWDYDGAVLTENVVDMFPSYIWGSTQALRMVNYNDTVVYTDSFAKVQRSIASPLYRLDPDTDTVTTHLAAYVVRDVIVRGDTCYALTVDVAVGGNFTGRIHSTTDFITWTEIASFTTDAPPQSFELMDDTATFYVGASGESYGGIYANSGAIYKIE